MKPGWRDPHDQGLTLTELLVAVIILAALSTLLLSSYRQHARSQTLQSAASATAEWLADIRKRAIQQNQACSIAISASNNTLQAANGNACGSFPSLDLSSVRTGSDAVRFCYRNNDPIEPAAGTEACSSRTTNSTAPLTFSPRGTNRLSAVFEFYSGTEQAGSCTLVIQPNGLIRYGTIRSGSCQASG